MFRAPSLPACLLLFSISIAGLAQAAEFEVAESTIDSSPFERGGPKIASDGDGFLVVWPEHRSNRGSVRAVRLDSAGVVLDEMGIVVADGALFHPVAVVWAGNEYVVAYECLFPSGNSAVCLSGVARDGTVRQLGTPIAPAQAPALAWNGRELLVVVSDPNGPAGSRENIFAHRVSLEGVRLGESFPLGRGYSAGVASAGEDFFAVWTMTGGAFGRFIGSDGSVGPPQTLVSYATQDLVFVDIDSNGSDYLIVWAEPYVSSSRSLIRVRQISQAGEQGDTSIVASSPPLGFFPAVSAEGTGYVVTYTASTNYVQQGGDVIAVRVDSGGFAGVPIELESETRFAGQGVVARNGSKTVAAWVSYGSRRYESVVAEIRVAPITPAPQTAVTVSRSTNWQLEPVGAVGGGRALVAWSEVPPKSDRRAVFIKSVEGPGRGALVRASSADQLHPVISGGVHSSLVFWLEVTGVPRRAGLFVRRLSRDGTLAGDAVVVAGEVGVSAIAAVSIGDQHTVFFQSVNRRIAMIRVSGDGRVLDPFPIDITQPRGDHWLGDIDPSAACDGSKILLSWKTLRPCSGVCVPEPSPIPGSPSR